MPLPWAVRPRASGLGRVVDAAPAIPAPAAALAMPRARRIRRALGATLRHPLIRGVLVVLLVLLLAGSATFAWVWQTTPSPAGLEAWIAQQDAAHHTPYVALNQISPWMGRALIAIEDERFYQHHGIDSLGLLRAAWDDLRAGHVVEGGSTLTAQLAKNAYLGGNDRALWSKLQDLVLALKVEQRYSKGEILEMYLNLVYYGEGAYGIQAAAERYFGTTPAKLDIAQSALLAGLVQAPGWFDPWCHPSDARARQAVVLAHMVDDSYLTQTQADIAQKEALAPLLPGAAHPADIYCAH
jgi:membrane peptidoglycan carboxypeptidase